MIAKTTPKHRNTSFCLVCGSCAVLISLGTERRASSSLSRFQATSAMLCTIVRCRQYMLSIRARGIASKVPSVRCVGGELFDGVVAIKPCPSASWRFMAFPCALAHDCAPLCHASGSQRLSPGAATASPGDRSMGGAARIDAFGAALPNVRVGVAAPHRRGAAAPCVRVTTNVTHGACDTPCQ